MKKTLLIHISFFIRLFTFSKVDLIRRLILFALVIIFFTTCRKDKAIPCNDFTNPECPNYNPCHGKSPVNADFTPYNIYLPQYNYLLSDSVLFGVGHFLAAPNESASYTWIFDNTDTLFGSLVDYGFCDNGCALSLSDTGLHSVKLIVKNICSPTSKDIDSISKTICFKSAEKAYMCGTYKGALDSNPADSFLVTIAYKPNPFVYNIHNDSTYHINGQWLVQDRAMEIRFDWSYNAGLHQLNAEVNPLTRIIIVDFSMENINNPGIITETNRFKGRKLN